jgi:hypothetical protein
MKVSHILMLAAIAAIIGLQSCNHSSPITSDGIATDPNTVFSDTIYFDSQIMPLMVSSCAYSGCHDAASKRHGVDLSTYSKIISTAEVVAGKPERSELYKVMIASGEDQMPPAGKLSNNAISLVYNWILQGALNNTNPNQACDSTQFSFAANVKPILNSYCTSCHNSITLSGGFSLENFSTVQSKANDGSLLGSIKHQSPYSAMPPGNMISDCNIAIVSNWIEAGAQNN